MINISKPILQKALIAGFFSAFTIGVLTVLTDPVGGAITGRVSRNRNSSVVLTVIIRFDEQNQVVDLAYHRSKF